MIVAIDHAIWGNGHGMRSPYFDDRFYWLSGELYHFFPGLGAQLTSYQWTRPCPGERRTLGGREYGIWRTERRWGRVCCKWALTRMPHNLNEANALLHTIEQELGRI